MSKKDMPAPVTKNSSKKDLWEELEAARNEIDQQQAIIQGLRAENTTLQRNMRELKNDLVILNYQVKTARAALSLTISDPS